MHQEPQHLFVAAAPRSGTTLMELVLSSHPDVSISPECRFIESYFRQGFPGHIPLEKKHAALLEDLMREDDKFSHWPDLDTAAWIDRQRPFKGQTIGAILTTLFYDFAIAAQQGTRILGNKKGFYAAGLGPYTRDIFPEAKFIFMIRDPRDVVRSNRVDLKRDHETICRDIMKRYTHIKEMRTLFPDSVWVHRFEDLICEPEQSIQSICDFIGIPFDPQMLRFYEKNGGGERLLGNRTNIHTNTTRPFDSSRIGQWEDALFTREELEQIETITAPVFRENGYALQTQV